MELRKYLEGLELNSKASYTKQRNTLGVEAPELPKLDGKEQAFFSEKTILSFAYGVPEQSRKDIISSTLLAQLAANKKVSDDENIMEWYEAFIDVLAKVGWVIEGGDVQSFKSKSNLFEAENVIIDILTSAFGANYIVVIKKTLEAIKKLASDDRRIKAFEKSTSKISKSSFQIALVTEQNGLVSLKIGTFTLSATRDTITVLFFKSDRQETELNYISKQATLDTDIFQEIRDLVKSKVGTFLRSSIAEIQLS